MPEILKEKKKILIALLLRPLFCVLFTMQQPKQALMAGFLRREKERTDREKTTTKKQAPIRVCSHTPLIFSVCSPRL